MTISDKDLLEAIYSQKDEAAFKVFYDRYAKLLHNWANKRTGNKEVTNDVVQNFWIIFWSTPYAIKVDENGEARKYLIHYFSYRMFDYLRSAAAKVIGDEQLFDGVKSLANYSHVFEELEVNEILTFIDEIVLNLPETNREIFQFVWESKHSVKEAATHFNVSEKVIRTKYNKVLTAVQSKVQLLLSEETTISDPKTILKLVVLLNLLEK
ncbi:RNA polymerase sigma factor [Flavobacterium sp.]|uniref:RNA polymerase sigma factor n=1 Tax=Flavobacterium sp. TaxID=239 RepID=UPI003C6A9966